MRKPDPINPTGAAEIQPPSPRGLPGRFVCDRCGTQMIELQCKIACPNCGNRFDCSDLSIYYDELKIEKAVSNHGKGLPA